jgi:hypothetical protein
MKKVICKQLRIIASGLPNQVETLPGKLAVKTLRTVRDKKGRPYFGLMTADASYLRPVNHYRRLKKAYRRAGDAGVHDYAKKVIDLAKKAGYSEAPAAPVSQDPRDMPGQLPAPQPPGTTGAKKRGRPKKEAKNG